MYLTTLVILLANCIAVRCFPVAEMVCCIVAAAPVPGRITAEEVATVVAPIVLAVPRGG